MKYERETCNLLRRLGVNNSYVGFRYTVYGVIRAIANPELLIYISKGLYVEISAEYHTSIGCVERNIRTIISTIWLHGDRAASESGLRLRVGTEAPKRRLHRCALALCCRTLLRLILQNHKGEENTGPVTIGSVCCAHIPLPAASHLWCLY